MSQSGCCASSPSPAPSPSAQNGREVRLKQYGVAETDSKGNREFLVKVVLLGDSGVGKTSIMRRFVDNSYSDDFKPTIGVDFATKEVTVKDASVKLQIWDTAGQERFRAIAGTYYRGASAALVVFDATNENSFQSVSRWVNEVFNSANSDGRNVIICIVANKCDLIEARKVSAEKVRDFITSNEIKAKFVEVSAKENRGIQEIFGEIAEAIAAGRHALNPY